MHSINAWLHVTVITTLFCISSTTALIVSAGENANLFIFSDSVQRTPAPKPSPPAEQSPSFLPVILGTASSPPEDLPILRQLNPHIVGGKRADADVTKRMVRVVGASRSGIIGGCTGSVITRNFILTAAHCFYLGTSKADRVSLSENSYVLVGERTTNVYYSKQRKNKYKMKRVFIHKRYGNFRHDIALIELDRKIKKKQYVPMNIGNIPSSSPVGVTVAGFGVKGSNKPTPRWNAQANVVYQAPRVCNDHLGFRASDGAKEICTTSVGFPDKGKTGTCFGDSGGPVFTKSDGTVYQIGVTSYFYGWKCQSPGTVHYAMRTSYYKKMILNKVKKGKNRGWKKL